MKFEKVLNNALKDIKIELVDEFDRNFERKAFFDGDPWDEPKKDPNIGSILNRSGRLRNSIHAELNQSEHQISFTSDTPYADIHNSGGEGLAWGKHPFTMPKRQFIGEHPEVENIVGNILDEHINDYMETLGNQIKNRFK